MLPFGGHHIFEHKILWNGSQRFVHLPLCYVQAIIESLFCETHANVFVGFVLNYNLSIKTIWKKKKKSVCSAQTQSSA